MSAANADTARSTARVFIGVNQDIRQKESNETSDNNQRHKNRNGSLSRRVILALSLRYSHSMPETEDPRAENGVLDAWLADFLVRNGGSSGTVHLYRDGGL